MFCAQRSGSVIDVFVHSVYDTLTVAGLELGLLWVGSFHSQPSLTPFNYPREREEFLLSPFSAEYISGRGPLARLVHLGCR